MYEIRFKNSASKELRKLPRDVAIRIMFAIEALADDPRPSGYRKIVGETNLYRIRIGSYRVIYSIVDAELHIEIVAVRHRKDAYR